MNDVVTDIDDLIAQATTERGHHYTAGVLRRAKSEIEALRIALRLLREPQYSGYEIRLS